MKILAFGIHPDDVELGCGGSVILAVLAALDHLWGFLLLEGVWALVSVGSLVSRARGG